MRPKGAKTLRATILVPLDPFGPLWNVDKPAMFGPKWTIFGPFPLPSHERWTSCPYLGNIPKKTKQLFLMLPWVKRASPFERTVRIAHLKEWWHWWRWCWNFLGIKTVLGFLFGFPPKSKHAHLYFIFLIFAKLITFHAKGLITILRFTKNFSCCRNSNNVDRLKSNLVSKGC